MTQQEAKDFWPLIKAWSEGGQLQTLDGAIWYNSSKVMFNMRPHEYRIKPNEPTLRPWKPEEVPVGALIKPKNVSHSDLWIITGRSQVDGKAIVYFSSWFLVGYPKIELLTTNYEHSLDNGKTWLPCGVLE